MARYDSDTKALAEAAGVALANLHNKIERASSVPASYDVDHYIERMIGARSGHRQKLAKFISDAYKAVRQPKREIY